MEGLAKERHASWLYCAAPRLSKVYSIIYLTILDIDDIMVVTYFCRSDLCRHHINGSMVSTLLSGSP